MHSALSMVKSMVTPADLKRMLAKAAVNHAQNAEQPRITPLDVARMLNTNPTHEDLEHEAHFVDVPTINTPSNNDQASLNLPENHAEQSITTCPSPALMPQKRASRQPTSFSCLNTQDLPIVREYSAGGLVFDDLGRVAIIARHSRNGYIEWCLPKGHIEKGETPQQTAVREIQEETGITGEIVESIATIDYWFTGTTQRVHKLVHHFALRYISGELTVLGDPDHEAEDAIWVHFSHLADILSYPNERKIAWLYAKKKHRRS